MEATADSTPLALRPDAVATTSTDTGLRRVSTEDWDGKRACDYVCPRCVQHFVSGEFWIQCDACREWFHGSCVFVREHESIEIEKFFCMTCEQEHGLSVLRPVTNDHRHDRTEDNAHEKKTQAGTAQFLSWLKSRPFPSLPQELMHHVSDGSCISPPALMQQREHGFRVPVLVDQSHGLHLRLPHCDLSVAQVLHHFSPDHVMDVIDSRRQLTFKCPAEEFVRLFNRDTDHQNIYNCISLEVSNTALGKEVQPPAVVSSMSWVDTNWPCDLSDKPNVSKYCLMSMADSYTDFHIDFGGTSVWYHVLRGEKVFYLVEPTDENLQRYEQWMQLKDHSEVFFGDLVDKCYRIHLTAGNTLLMPTAWIHAVLTPADSLVFGGNFLHSLNMKMQIRVHEMEERMRTPAKFQFPFFERIHWYSVPTTVSLLRDWSSKQSVPIPKDLLSGASALLSSLKRWATSQDPQSQEQQKMPNSTIAEAKKLVPDGFDCRRAIKDLKNAIKLHKPKDKDGHKKKRKHDTLKETVESMTGTVIGLTSDLSSDGEDRNLVIVDEGAIESIRRQVKEQEERKGFIKMRLSLCGKSGLPEVTAVDAMAPPSVRSSKRKRRSTSIEDDPEIMDMIRDRPEDDDFIYLDVETAADEDDMGPVSSDDHAWCPRAKVVITGSRKEARPVRENARRELMETCLANAAAKMEHAISVKTAAKRAARRKSRTSSSGSGGLCKRAESTDDMHQPLSPSVASTSLNVPKSEESERKTSPTPRARKGEKTAKQRLAKLMRIGKR